MGKGKILIVDDSDALGGMTKTFLESKGYDVTWITTGLPAFQLAKTEPIDVILLDRILPDIDGLRICSLLKQDKDTHDIPIIMLTSMNSTEDKVKGLEAGADDYLPKPYEDDELNARVYAALRTKLLRDELRRKNEELEKTLVKLETLSMTDPLTGLFNRRRFEEILRLEFRKATRYRCWLTCLMIDIDKFKTVNDTYGHAVGDKVIQGVAQIIQTSVRDTDTACRWGGEEFVVLAPMTPKKEALQSARRILAAVSGHAFPDLPGVKMTVSIGVADMPRDDIDNGDKLIQAADKALYEAKKNGRNRIE